MVILVIETEAKNNEYELIKKNPSKNRVTYRVDEYVHQNKGITSVQIVMRKKRKQSQYNNLRITVSVITISVITRNKSPSSNLQQQDLKYTFTVIHVIFECIYSHRWIIYPFTFLIYTSYIHNYTFGYQTFGQIELELKHKHSAK